MMIRKQAGDTLIEVTMALAILAFVLLGATLVGTAAYRTGQSARERTQMSDAAQAQMEALRSFRDNHSWAQFQNGTGPYQGVNTVGAKFHMKYQTTVAGVTEWVPVPGTMTDSELPVPTSTLYIESVGSSVHEACDYDFRLTYEFTPLGNGVPLKNVFQTRLVNLKYTVPTGGTSVCLP